jgi:hypothetical protein
VRASETSLTLGKSGRGGAVPGRSLKNVTCDVFESSFSLLQCVPTPFQRPEVAERCREFGWKFGWKKNAEKIVISGNKTIKEHQLGD